MPVWIGYSDVPVDVTVSATCQALTLTEYPATVNLNVNVAATCETLTLTEYPASVFVTAYRQYDNCHLADYSGALKMGILQDHTFSAADVLWSDVSADELPATGTYTTGGELLTAGYVEPILTITDLDVDFVTAATVSHVVVYNSDSGRLMFAIEYDTLQNFNNASVTFDFPATGWALPVGVAATCVAMTLVTYPATVTAPSIYLLATVGGVAPADIATIGDVAIADIATVGGADLV
jgi:hypothetical protein